MLLTSETFLLAISKTSSQLIVDRFACLSINQKYNHEKFSILFRDYYAISKCHLKFRNTVVK